MCSHFISGLFLVFSPCLLCVLSCVRCPCLYSSHHCFNHNSHVPFLYTNKHKSCCVGVHDDRSCGNGSCASFSTVLFTLLASVPSFSLSCIISPHHAVALRWLASSGFSQHSWHTFFASASPFAHSILFLSVSTASLLSCLSYSCGFAVVAACLSYSCCFARISNPHTTRLFICLSGYPLYPIVFLNRRTHLLVVCVFSCLHYFHYYSFYCSHALLSLVCLFCFA